MKANELMIGDWILSGGEPMKVIRLTDKINMIDDNKTKWFAEEVHPIPFTAELLEKNEFVKQEYEWWKLNTADWCININLFNGKERYALSVLGKNAQVSLHGYYVHELQHALRLCGITELADNFKV